MTYRSLALTSSLLIVPALVLALDFSGEALPYPDVALGTPEAAGIRLLTSEGIVGGYPDGTFRPARLLNRAEFLKIVMESHPEIAVTEENSATCFPDVTADEWFSRYVCLAKERGVVVGYPDGTFKPAQNVNYAEALKMLSEVYEYDLPEPAPNERWAWYTGYLRAAEQRGVALEELEAGHEIRRGEMARLAAAYIAEREGMLSAYRAAEQGDYTTSSSSESSSSSSSSSSSFSSSSSSSSTSLSHLPYTLPITSTFLVVGETSLPVAHVDVPDRGEDVRLTFARVQLQQEVSSVQAIEITDRNGTVLVSLPQKTLQSDLLYKRTYEYYLPPESSVLLGEGAKTLFARVVMKKFDVGGASNQLLDVSRIEYTTQGTETLQTYTAGQLGPFPTHQTSFGRITSIESTSPQTGQLTSGTGRLLGSFRFAGEALTGKTLTLKALLFTVESTGALTISNWHLALDSGQTHACALGVDGLSCNVLPEPFSSAIRLGSTVHLRADVAVGESPYVDSLRVSLKSAGSPSVPGAVSWADDAGTFRWVDADAPLAEGIMLRE